MNNYRTLLSVLLFVGALDWNVVAESSSDSAGAVVLAIEGRVETAVADSKEWSLVRTNQVLQVGDRLRTGLRSRAMIRMSDLSVLRVNELTTIKIRPPENSNQQQTLQVDQGETYFFNRERPAKLNFRTPLASGAIRGTEFNLAVSDSGETVVTLMEGKVTLQNDAGSVELASGEEGIVEPGEAPRKTSVIHAYNTIQWCLYYPAVLDPAELDFSEEEKEALGASLGAYRHGGLPGALEHYPADRTPQSDAENVYLAQLLLSAGQVEQAETLLTSIQLPTADALRTLIAAVKFQTVSAGSTDQTSASLLMADSYYQQSIFRLEAARAAARRAVERAPDFGYAWQRLAELEFCFGNSEQAKRALFQCLELSPQNAQALVVKGFLLAAENKTQSATACFEKAIALDGALGNAWLGRGLVRIYQGDKAAGALDLQTAAALEPNRSLLRSSLGKAFADAGDFERAEKEIGLAQQLDPNDPTSWLYLALMNRQQNKINAAVRSLEKSVELNDNRSLFRSKLLLDQDRAVRSANLAKIYQDAGMTDVGVREASRAVTADYANYSAHRFLADSYDALRDPNQVNLRYETAWYSELMLSQLLAPAGAANLSRNVSQQEYSRFFEGKRVGFTTIADYTSEGDLRATASQYGNDGTFSYSFDAEYLNRDGSRPNSDTEQRAFYLKMKDQITPQDSVMIEVQTCDASFGDTAQYYNHYGTLPGQPSPGTEFQGDETQTPNVYLGYHHEWSPGSHTLFLAGRLDDTLSYSDPQAQIPFYRYTTFTRVPWSLTALNFPLSYERKLTIYSSELQQVQQAGRHTFILGGRYQTGDADTETDITNPYNATQLNQREDIDFYRWSLYAYDQWQLLDSLMLVGGVSYDRLHYPDNIDTAPISSSESSADQVSPKAGIIWTPQDNLNFRGSYTRSLGGIYHDNSVRLEPTGIAGFNQAFRSLIPESVAGVIPATEFETWGLGYDQAFNNTYVAIQGAVLSSDSSRFLGVYTNATFPVADSPSGTPQTLDYREETLSFSCNQLIGDDWSLGALYSIGEASLDQRTPDIPSTISGAGVLAQDANAILQRLNLSANFNHPSGFFGRAEALWKHQDNRADSDVMPDDEFWQFNLYAGYRFSRRRAELRLGLLNLTDQNYRLNPLNLYYELPRERMLAVHFKLDL